MALEDYIAVKPKTARFVPHTAGRYQKKRFRKAQCPIVERCAAAPHLLENRSARLETVTCSKVLCCDQQSGREELWPRADQPGWRHRLQQLPARFHLVISRVAQQ